MSTENEVLLLNPSDPDLKGIAELLRKYLEAQGE